MKIVYLNPSGGLGGAERSLLDLLASLREARPDWPLHLVAGEDGPLLKRVEALGVGVTLLPFPARLARIGDAGAGGVAGKGISMPGLLVRLLAATGSAIGYVRRLKAVLRALQPDVIHSNGFKTHILGSRAAPINVPVVWHVRDYIGLRPVVARLLRLHTARCAGVITTSENVRLDTEAALGCSVPIHKIVNAIDLERFEPMGNRLDLDRIAGLESPVPGVVRVGLPATFARWKGQDVFLAALARLPPDSLVRGYVIGDAIYRTEHSQFTLAELRRMADQFGLTGRVGFVGFVEEPASALRALDIVVHASTRPEPFGRVVVEAMACGKPVITSGAGAIVEGSDAGAVMAFAPGDHEGLAQAIESLARDPSRRIRLGQAGLPLVAAHFDRRRLGREIAAVYTGLKL